MYPYLFIIYLLLACGPGNGKREINSSTQQKRSNTAYVDTLKGKNTQEKPLRIYSSLKDRYNSVFESLNDNLFDESATYKKDLFEGDRFFYSKKDSTLIEVNVTYPKITVNRSFYLQDPKKYNFKLLLSPYQIGFLKEREIYFLDIGIIEKEFLLSDLHINGHIMRENGIRYKEIGRSEYLTLRRKNEAIKIMNRRFDAIYGNNDYITAALGNKLTSFFEEYANRYLSDYADDLDGIQIRFDLVFELDGRLSLSEISLMHYKDGKYDVSPLRRDCSEHIVDLLTKQTKWENKTQRRTFHSINYNVGLKI